MLFRSEWYQPVSAVKGTLIDPGFSDLVISEPVKYSFRVLARSPVPALFRLLDGSEIIKSILIPGVNISSISGTYAQHAETSGTITPATISPVFEMKFFNNGESSALGWIDFVILQGRRINKFNGITTHFTDSRSAAGGTVTAFSIDYSGEGGIIWDVTDPVNVKNIRYSKDRKSVV